ncbi:MAG: transcription elongation factor Spt5 [Candidatus Heimdallarchaeota archaeon]|nr:transcription elongation factor Spt5 [Candidatus Heimdallarchaeota archaeon]
MSTDAPAPKPSRKRPSQIFAVRTTTGQEKGVAILIAEKAVSVGANVTAVMAPESLRGYVYIEAPSQRDVLVSIAGLRHVRGKVVGKVSIEEIEHVLIPRSPTEGLEEGDFVEIIRGPFKGEKARVTQIIANREEVVLQLLESTYPIPIRVHGDFIKIIEKGSREERILK